MKIRALLIAVIIILVAVSAYMLTPSAQNPVNQDDAAADTVPPIDDTTRAEANHHIDELTRESGKQTLDIGKADNFVTADQLLKLPHHESSAAVESTSDDSDSVQTYAADLPGNGSPVTAPDYQSSELPAADQVSLKELLDSPDDNGEHIFFIHSVNANDKQGMWGIMQRGLTNTFARGLKLNSDSRVLQATIPEDADERHADKTSSFLGSLLNRKVEQTLVYNYSQGLLGSDPNLIKPGQQLIIIRFSKEELIEIYNYFVNQPSS